MARKAATIEYLEKLVEWAGDRSEFCRLTGVTPANLAAYLGGSKRVSWKWLHNATRGVCGEPPAFIPILEGYDLWVNDLPDQKAMPKTPGVYALYDSAMRILYFGRASSLYSEVRQTLKRKVAEVRPWSGKKNLTFEDISAYVSAYIIARGDSEYVHDLESFVLRMLVNNTFNKNSGYFKRTK
ncbi:MAG: hypothetical protein HUJ31_12470 [Pseudomonadales bacterium]|nr:hypothetical protein [Pseudomonadales bacterium]